MTRDRLDPDVQRLLTLRNRLIDAALQDIPAVPMATFAEIMEARVLHEPHGPQWQVGWLGQTGAMYPITTSLEVIHAEEPGSYCPLYMDAKE